MACVAPSFRFLCGLFRSPPLLSSHRFPGLDPQVGHWTDRAWSGVTSLVFTLPPSHRSPAKAVHFCTLQRDWAYTRTAVEAYERETKDVIRRFLGHKLTFPGCIAALDAALARLIPHMQPAQLYELRDLMLANNSRVMEEMAHRAASHTG